MLVIGLDVHKDSLAAAVVDHAGRQVDCGTFDNTDDGHASLLAWANTHGARLRVGMEPSGGVARRLAHSLETAGHICGGGTATLVSRRGQAATDTRKD